MMDGFGNGWAVYIRWDVSGDHTSPPIGPFDTHTEAKRAASKIRKKLKASGAKWQDRVHVTYVASLEQALSWCN